MAVELYLNTFHSSLCKLSKVSNYYFGRAWILSAALLLSEVTNTRGRKTVVAFQVTNTVWTAGILTLNTSPPVTRTTVRCDDKGRPQTIFVSNGDWETCEQKIESSSPLGIKQNTEKLQTPFYRARSKERKYWAARCCFQFSKPSSLGFSPQ